MITHTHLQGNTGPWASYQIRKIAGAHAPGMLGAFFPSPQVSNPDMHHGTCVTHVPWCMPGSLTSGLLWHRRRGKTFPASPAHAQPVILRIWQEAHSTSTVLGPRLTILSNVKCVRGRMIYTAAAIIRYVMYNLASCCHPDSGYGDQ